MPAHIKLLKESAEAKKRRLVYQEAYDKSLSLEQRERKRQCAAAWYQANKELANKRNREWYHKNKHKNRDKVRDAALQRQYGITLQQKEEMYRNQNGLCGICGLPLPEDFRKSAVDHNHFTGAVRELAHRECNSILGYEERSPGLLSKVLEYKKRWDAFETGESV